ncbi:MAG: glycerol kinase GlpK [Acidaminococcaceae bacterium]|jgi:glycerol kinase|nr:glycerol kinase GlpK [Acidaminococcaceae bacterium]
MAYIIGIDQSTQGTKALLFDGAGKIVLRVDKPHRQIVNSQGWVEHDPEEIYANTLALLRQLVQQSGVKVAEIAALGISNQRETALAWNRDTGKPVYNAIVWQCARGAAICARLEKQGVAPLVRAHTGLQLSPYFSAAKLAWILENVPGTKELMAQGKLCLGTMDSFLVFRLTHGKVFKTDASNASRTQLLDIRQVQWDPEIGQAFGIQPGALPEVCASDSLFGVTDAGGLFTKPVPIHAVFGDSHAALYGQGCHAPGMIKATYGTGSSVMMNIGAKPIWSQGGLVTSLAWQLGQQVSYVLEGNINYTGAGITWLKDDLQLIGSAAETEQLAREARAEDHSYFVPAFTGLGAPYWDSQARGLFCNITRNTGRREMVRAVLDAIAYQIRDITDLMERESGRQITALRVDGGPTRNKYLMQFQTDITKIPVEVAGVEELSALGAAYGAGIATGVYDTKIFAGLQRTEFAPQLEEARRQELYRGWQAAVARARA